MADGTDNRPVAEALDAPPLPESPRTEPVLPVSGVRGQTETILQPDALRATYETFEDFGTAYRNLNAMLEDVLALHPEVIPEMRQILDEAVLLYRHPYQYHNAVHMLITTCFAMDRAIRVNQLRRDDKDVVDKVRNVVTMVGYHDTGNGTAPRPNAVDEMEAIEQLLQAIAAAPENHPLHAYATNEHTQARNMICAAILASFFRDRFVDASVMMADTEQQFPSKYGYVNMIAKRLGIEPPFALAAMVTENKYGKLMKNADISSSLAMQRLKNLFLNHWEDLQRENSTFVGQACREYDAGFKMFITGKFTGPNDDPDAVADAQSGRPMLTVPGIATDTERDARMLEEASAYMNGIFAKHEAFINLVFADFNIATGGAEKRDLMRLPLSELLSSLRTLQGDPSALKAVFMKKNNRQETAADGIVSAISAVDIAGYEARAQAAGLNGKCWAQLTEDDLCHLLGEPEPQEFAFAKTAEFAGQ